jgi:GTP cyclohydrolase II
VEANLALGFRDDERDYAVAAHMLQSLKVKSIRLMTNNPKKINDLTKYGVLVNGRIPHVLPANPYNEFYLRQEGRGIGLTNKIRAYGLQDYGMDTVEANLALGFRDDERDYAVAAHMLQSLKVKSIRLMTNNPKKINDLTKYGIKVNGRIPHVLPTNPYNEFYLRTKAEKSGHLIDLKDFKGKIHLPEQLDRPVVKGMSKVQVEALQE